MGGWPAGAVTIKSYRRLEEYVAAFRRGAHQSAHLGRTAGTGKVAHSARHSSRRMHLGLKEMPQRSGCTSSSSAIATALW